MNKKWSTLLSSPRCRLCNVILAKAPGIKGNLMNSSPKLRRLLHSDGGGGMPWPRPLDETVSKILDDQEIFSNDQQNIFDTWCADIEALRKAFTLHPFPKGKIPILSARPQPLSLFSLAHTELRNNPERGCGGMRRGLFSKSGPRAGQVRIYTRARWRRNCCCCNHCY